MIFDAVILAGGHSSRLGGADKALVVIDGKTLLEHTVDAAVPARETIVVGPFRKLPAPVTWVEEEPRGGGPGAALVAGVGRVRAGLVVVLAVDYPLLTRRHVERLVASVEGDGVVALDSEGRAQPLLAVYRREPLAAVLADRNRAAGARMRDLVANLELSRVGLGDAAADCDTWDAIEAIRARPILRG